MNCVDAVPESVAFNSPVSKLVSRQVMLLLLWVVLVGGGFLMLYRYGFDGEAPPHAALRWPSTSAVALSPHRPTLLYFVHPRCPCTAAGIAELDRALSEYPDAFATHVVFPVPDGAPQDWVGGKNYDASLRLPGASLLQDRGGKLAVSFGALSSGTAFVYGTDGALLFDGGLTASRGHEGLSTGGQALRMLAGGDGKTLLPTPVFGCPLMPTREGANEEQSL